MAFVLHHPPLYPLQRAAARVIADRVSMAELEHARGTGTLAGHQEAARILSSSGGPAGAFLAVLPGGHMTVDDEMFVVAVWRRMGTRVPTDTYGFARRGSAGLVVGLPQPLCDSAPVATDPYEMRSSESLVLERFRPT